MKDQYLSAAALAITSTRDFAPVVVNVPGSKSITNRALLLAGLARGHSSLSGVLESDDTKYMRTALSAMGVRIEQRDATSLSVIGSGELKAPNSDLFLGNAGTATRFLTAAVALAHGKVVVDGDAHMRKRPIEPLVRSLQGLGISISAVNGCPPVTVHATGGFNGQNARIDAGVSSQFVSAVLMLAACGQNPVEVTIEGADEVAARGYIDLTLNCMKAFGAQYEALDERTWRVAPTGYHATNFDVEPDASAATYIWAVERLQNTSLDLSIPIQSQDQPDTAARAMMASFPNMPAVINGAQMQDAIPTLAVLAAFNRKAVRFVGISNLRVKECDRIRALQLGLNQLSPGLAHEDGDDLVVSGRLEQSTTLPSATNPAIIDTFSDHRIAMSFALAGLRIPYVNIQNPGCVSKTFPSYWKELERLGIQLSIIQ